MQADVAINALGRPYQTLLCVASLCEYNLESINKIFLIIDAATPKSDIEKFQTIREHCPAAIEYVYSEVSHGYFDNIVGPFEDEKYRMGIRYQYAWEKSQEKYLFISHNDCVFKGPVVSELLRAIEDNLIIGHLGVCWNCPAYWAKKCERGQYLSYKPTYEELCELFATVVPPRKVTFDYGYHKSNFNEKWRKHPWPLPMCRVNEWCCLVDLQTAKEVTIPHGDAVPFGATTYIGDILVDTSCEWFHDVINKGHIAKDFPVECYIEHKHGIGQYFSREKYLLNEKAAVDTLRELQLI